MRSFKAFACKALQVNVPVAIFFLMVDCVSGTLYHRKRILALELYGLGHGDSYAGLEMRKKRSIGDFL